MTGLEPSQNAESELKMKSEMFRNTIKYHAADVWQTSANAGSYSAPKSALSRLRGTLALLSFAVALATEVSASPLSRAALVPSDAASPLSRAAFVSSDAVSPLSAAPALSGANDTASGATLATQTPGRAAELLEKLAAGFRAMPAYRVDFEIETGDSSVQGSYAVQGEDYYLEVGDAEVFADGKVRYEVDNRRREVTVNAVDTSSRSILDNPVRAFDFLDSDYTPRLLGERDGHAAVSLTPTAAAGSVAGEVTVTLTVTPVRPVRVAYDYDGERITVSVVAIKPLSGALKRFDRTAYRDYEFIDFR